MKISFFGASVTQQKGYVDEFEKRMLPNNYNINVYKHGYGSTHLNDAMKVTREYFGFNCTQVISLGCEATSA